MIAPSAEQGGSEKSQPSNWSLFARLFAFGLRYRAEAALVIVLQLMLTAATLAGLALVGLGIDIARRAADPSSPEPHFPLGWRPGPEWTPWQLLMLTAGGVLLFAALRGFLSYKHSVASSKLIHRRIIAGLRAAVYDRLQRLSFHFFDAHDSGSVINRVTADVQGVRMFVDGVVLQLLVVLISLGFYLAYMLSIHVWLTLACLATTPILWIATVWFSRIVRPGYDKNRELVDKMIQRLTENVQGVQVVKGFALEEVEQQRFREASQAVLDQQRWLCMRNSIYTPAVSFMTQVNLTVLLMYGGWLSMTGELPLGTGLVVFAGLLQQFSSQVTNVASIANSVQQSLTGARRVFEILDAPIDIQSPPDAVKFEKAVGSVKFENVQFSYRENGPIVLQNVDFEVQPGQCVAILGATGAGKSTLLSLIPRFHDPQHGRVLVDGRDVKDLDLDDLRRNVGVVFQESFLFSNTIWANIAFGAPNATREQVEKAARIAAAHDFIMELPNGYDSVLGEAGIDLSGGQRQRLALARALVLEPSILLLDDPTAAIDPSTEEEILAAMESSMRGRTTFVVAHRLSTLRRADLVLVLDRGRIVQRGSHAELMEQTGLYRKAALHQTGLLDDLSASDYWLSDPQPS